eukprot:g8592.t1
MPPPGPAVPPVELKNKEPEIMKELPAHSVAGRAEVNATALQTTVVVGPDDAAAEDVDVDADIAFASAPMVVNLGRDSETKLPIVLVAPYFLNDLSDDLFEKCVRLYCAQVVKWVQNEQFLVVFCNTGVRAMRHLDLAHIYDVVPDVLEQNVKEIFVLHPTMSYSLVAGVNYLLFGGDEMREKISDYESLGQLIYDLHPHSAVKRTQVLQEIPFFVLRYESEYFDFPERLGPVFGCPLHRLVSLSAQTDTEMFPGVTFKGLPFVVRWLVKAVCGRARRGKIVFSEKDNLFQAHPGKVMALVAALEQGEVQEVAKHHLSTLWSVLRLWLTCLPLPLLGGRTWELLIQGPDEELVTRESVGADGRGESLRGEPTGRSPATRNKSEPAKSSSTSPARARASPGESAELVAAKQRINKEYDMLNNVNNQMQTAFYYPEVFETSRGRRLPDFQEEEGAPEVTVGRVVVPTDGRSRDHQINFGKKGYGEPRSRGDRSSGSSSSSRGAAIPTTSVHSHQSPDETFSGAQQLLFYPEDGEGENISESDEEEDSSSTSEDDSGREGGSGSGPAAKTASGVRAGNRRARARGASSSGAAGASGHRSASAHHQHDHHHQHKKELYVQQWSPYYSPERKRFLDERVPLAWLRRRVFPHLPWYLLHLVVYLLKFFKYVCELEEEKHTSAKRLLRLIQTHKGYGGTLDKLAEVFAPMFIRAAPEKCNYAFWQHFGVAEAFFKLAVGYADELCAEWVQQFEPGAPELGNDGFGRDDVDDVVPAGAGIRAGEGDHLIDHDIMALSKSSSTTSSGGGGASSDGPRIGSSSTAKVPLTKKNFGRSLSRAVEAAALFRHAGAAKQSAQLDPRHQQQQQKQQTSLTTRPSAGFKFGFATSASGAEADYSVYKAEADEKGDARSSRDIVAAQGADTTCISIVS